MQTLPVLFGVVLIAFLLSQASGSPVRGLLGPSTNKEIVRKVEEYYGLHKPWPEQFLAHLNKLAHGDLGVSIASHGQPVLQMIIDGLKVTSKLALGAILIATVCGVTSGILSAWRPYSLIDYGSSVFAAIGISFPAFFLAMLLMLVFSVSLRWFPIGGYQPGEIKYLILPCFSLGMISTASIARLTRNCMLDTLSQDYVRSARAKGLEDRSVLLGHALPNALVTVITVIGNDLAGLLVGAVLTETVFGLPGIGSVISSAIFTRDLTVVMGCCIFFALVFVIINLLVDLTYAFLDPRIRHA